MTAAVAALAAIVRANALLEVARFNPFTPDNHPYCAHDPPTICAGLSANSPQPYPFGWLRAGTLASPKEPRRLQ